MSWVQQETERKRLWALGLDTLGRPLSPELREWERLRGVTHGIAFQVIPPTRTSPMSLPLTLSGEKLPTPAKLLTELKRQSAAIAEASMARRTHPTASLRLEPPTFEDEDLEEDGEDWENEEYSEDE